MRHPAACIPDGSHYPTCCGDSMHTIYASRISADGSIELRPKDQIDIQMEINSHAGECDMSLILARLQSGDTSVLNSSQPIYGDLTKFPKTYAEMLQIVSDGDLYFSSLPKEIRAKFDFDKYKWFSSIGTQSWYDRMKVSRDMSHVRQTQQSVNIDRSSEVMLNES